ncbi:ABC transporter permease subunit [Neobacillus sp. YIM B06451]|uniref:ABC transporter permease subunit n=1 Tax=Neobacillus sp. YIM B06451 TaxID=3070994 RepID=UPI00292D70DF|nr:ABC transporter permease subunit [Neobacillus sp. YIM B06451]
MHTLGYLVRYLISLFALLILAAIPQVFYYTGNPMLGQQQIAFEPKMIVIVVRGFLEGILSAESFYYISGSSKRFFPSDIVGYFNSSYFYVAGSGLIVILLSFVFGIWLWKASGRYLNGILSFLGMIPDFIFILILQLLVNGIYKSTGIKTVKVASLSTNEPAIFLPILTLVIIPFVYLVRTLNERTHEVITEDYIVTAVAKGLSKIEIYLFHITTNVIPFLKADLHKVTSIMISNLFIVEYLYNTRGITTMLFQLQVKFGYQYNVVVLSLFTLVLLYIAVFLSFKLLIILIERILKHA